MGDLFGTFGIRKVANTEFSPKLAQDLGLALSNYLDGEGKVDVGYDPRTSSEMLKSALMSGIVSGGTDVVDFGMIPTPVLSFGTKNTDCDAGIMITASHNPPEYNGMKFWDDQGAGFVREKESRIEELVEEDGDLAAWDELGEMFESEIISRYKKAVVDRVGEFEGEMKVVIDCANGAGSVVTPQLLRELGCKVITLNSQPDGHFPGRLPEPTEEHIEGLTKAVESMGADLGVAHDGDADRTILVDENGEILSGDRVFALAAKNYLRDKKSPRIVTSVATSSLLKDVAHEYGGDIAWTKVGEPELIRELRDNGGDLAGEENGGVIFPDWLYCRDGIMSAVQIIDYALRTGKTLSELNEGLPEYKQFKKKVECPNELKGKVLDRLYEKLRDKNPNTTDGLRINTDDGWYILRPSGTEPIFRCFSEAKTEERAKEMVESGMSLLKKTIDSVKSS